MSVRGLDYQPLHIPLAAGLNQKSDPRAKVPPYLDIAKDVQAEQVGGLQTRYPFAALGNSIAGGGTISNARRIVEYGNEKLLFTDTALYSWNAQASAWVLKGTHLATKVDEAIRFASNGDQQSCDRAELSDAIVYAWSDGGFVYVAALDKTTGNVTTAPTQPAVAGGAAQGTRPRLVALSTKILFTMVANSGDLVAYTIDPASVALSISGAATTVLAAASFDTYYDITRIPGADSAIAVCRRQTKTAYSIIKITSALALSSATPGRTCNGAIAVSVTPDGASAQVIRVLTAGSAIKGDLITVSSLADVYTNQAVGTYTTGVNQIAAAHRSVQNSAHYRCYAFWSQDEQPGGGGAEAVKYNYVDDGNNLGSEATFLPWCGVASRAFDYNGSVYVWIVQNHSSNTLGFLQGVYLLYRDDGLLVATSRVGNAYYASVTSNLPGVALTSGSTEFSFCGAYTRNVAAESAYRGFTARAPRDVVVTFDSNEARRCARVGATLYISGSPVMQYDGRQLTELGWLVGPMRFTVGDGGAGPMGAGAYAYKPTLRWMNATGEVDRSSSFDEHSVTIAASHYIGSDSSDEAHAVWTTRKTGATWELWRTAVNPTASSPFYLVTSNDPTTTNPNAYIANSLTSAHLASFVDNETDATATVNEANPENGGVLENLPPPPATIIAADDTRLYLAGIAGDPNRVWYSKLREDGKVVSFNDALTFTVPKDGGAITALAFLNETLCVFCETATFMVPGDGFDNTGAGANYGPARFLSTDLGAESADAVEYTQKGLIVKTGKGWFILDKGWSFDDIGNQVQDYDSETVLAVHVMTAQQQVRVLTASRMLVWDYHIDQWFEWSISDGVHACIWAGAHVYLTSTGPKVQGTSYSGLTYGIDVETAWIKFSDNLQGRAYVRLFQVLGEYRSNHSVRIRVARDYLSDGAGGWLYFDDVTWPVTPTTAGGPEQVRHGPSQKRCQAIKIRLSAVLNVAAAYATGTATPIEGDTFTLSLTAKSTGPTLNGHTFRIQSDGAGTGTLTDGLDAIFHFEPNVTTISDLIAATASSAYYTATGSGTVINRIGSSNTTMSSGADAAVTAPTGEALKLTGLVLDVGVEPGVYQGLSTAQRA